MKRTPFYNFHKQHNARFVDFFGWEMPVTYSSIIEEHNQVRNGAGLFDVSHMGRFKFTGRHARRLLERVLSRRVSDMKTGRCRYSMVCNERGGVMDDVLVYRFDEHWLMVVNASNREKLWNHFQSVQEQNGWTVKLEDQTESTAMVAVQGPRVIEMVGKFSKEIPSLKRFQFAEKNLMILKMIVSRTGYTGEDGVEVILPAKMADMAVKLLLRDTSGDGVKPIGLGARDTLRLEAALPLYGHELDEETDPLSAGLGFAVNLDKDQDENGEAFIGLDALKQIEKDGPPRQLVGLTLDGRRTPRQGHAVQSSGGEAIGHVTSGCLSPTLGHPIAMAYVNRGTCNEGDTVQIDMGRSSAEAKVVGLPFYKR